MNPKALRERGITADLHAARLPDWKLTFTPLPSIVPAASHYVAGCYADLTESEAEAITTAVAPYDVQWLELPILADQQETRAKIFAATGEPIRPTGRQLAQILIACKEAGVGETYQRMLLQEARSLPIMDLDVTPPLRAAIPALKC